MNSITTIEGLRLGNLMLVDDMVYPPNFILGRIVQLGPGWEKMHEARSPSVYAYVPITPGLMERLLPDGNEFQRWRGAFEARPMRPGDTICAWWIQYGDHGEEVHYMHQVQNHYRDWTGEELPLK